MRAEGSRGVLLSVLLVTSLIVPLLSSSLSSNLSSASPSPDPPENFTIVVLPDTQNYSTSYPSIFENQTKWIVQNENVLNIVFVAHLGDICNYPDVDSEWQNADNAMSILDSKVPYGILPGNHDMTAGGDVPKYENHFPASRYEGYSYWGGSYNHNKNNYQLFSAGGMDFIALNLEYRPPDHVLDWADSVLDNYLNRRAIISTHQFLSSDNTRNDPYGGNSEGNNGGQSIWDNLVVPNNNVFLVLCGHIVEEAKRSDTVNNRTVHQLLSNYQFRPNGGNGWLRIMEFVPNEGKIYVRTYSPYLDQYETDENSQFELSYPMGATGGLTVSTLGAENIGYTSADLKGELENLGGASSAEVWFQWRMSGALTWENTSKQTLYSSQEFSKSLSGLSEGTTYEFRAVADNSTNMDYGSVLTFETLPPWEYYGWGYRKEITIDQTKVDFNLDNFPILIDITDPDLKTHAMDNGDDILFTSSDGETKIPHEIELYNSSNGHLVAHVRVPYLSAVENTIIFMYYGNPGASNQENATGVWDDNYVMVQHLEETSGTHYDSTSNGNNGTPYGGVTQDAAGKINGADEFDGENDWVGVSNPSFPVTDELTVSAWIKPKQFRSYVGFVHKSASTGTKSFYLGGAVDNGETGKWRFTTFTTSGRVDLVVTGTLTLNEWNFIVGVYDGSKMKSYLNGSFVNDILQSGNVTYDNTEITIGVDHPSWGTYENGFIDEVRISNVARSAGWISTTFNNENSPSTFYSVGEEATMGLAVSTLGAENIGYTSAGIKGELENLGAASSADVWFQWRESGTPTWENTSKQTLYSPQEFSKSLSGLSEGKTYEFRAVADNSTDVDYGSILTFKMLTHVSWWNSDWLYRKEITIDQTKVDFNLDNFPILIDITDPDLKVHAMDNGDDILFTSSDGETKIPHEIELYDSSNGRLVAHVRVPYLSAGENTIIFMYYGNPGASNQENATGVWDDNYVMVQHMKDNTTSSIEDSTNNNNDGTKKGSNEPIENDGKIAKAQDFDGSNDYVNCGNDSSLDINDTITIEVWAKRDVNDVKHVLASKFVPVTPPYDGWQLSLSTANLFRFATTIDSSWVSTYSTSTITDQDWHHYVATFNGTTKVYIDGNDVTDTSQTGTTLGINTHVLYISADAVPANYFNGTIDEVRISNVARSAGWISTTFNNENSPNTFYSVGSEEAIVRGVKVTISPAENSGLPGATLAYTVTVTNTGNVPDNYSLENSDNAGWVLSLDNDQLSIPACENRTTTLRVTIPGDATGCTRDNMAVTATSVENENVSYNASAIAHVQVVRGVEVLIEPDNQPGVIGENVVFTITVKNTGNIWDNYNLTPSDDAGWTLKLDNDYLEIPENENRETKLTVTIPDNENLVCTTDNVTIVATAVDNAEVTDNYNATVHAVPSWSGTADFSLANLYTVNVEKILDLNQGSKLVVKFYTYGDAFENENVIENFTPPWHVEENELARHPGPGRVGVKKARLYLTTDDTGNAISTIVSYTVRKVDLEVRFTQIPLEWALAPTPEEKTELEIEFSEVPLYWALAQA